MRPSFGLTRRGLLQGLVAVVAPAAAAAKGNDVGQTTATRTTAAVPYDPAVLPAGIRSRFVDNINGLRMHVLEAGFEVRGRHGVVLLHGFSELAYSWRKGMSPIAFARFHL